jgi:hypothetical protein
LLSCQNYSQWDNFLKKMMAMPIGKGKGGSS